MGGQSREKGQSGGHKWGPVDDSCLEAFRDELIVQSRALL